MLVVQIVSSKSLIVSVLCSVATRSCTFFNGITCNGTLVTTEERFNAELRSHLKFESIYATFYFDLHVEDALCAALVR